MGTNVLGEKSQVGAGGTGSKTKTCFDFGALYPMSFEAVWDGIQGGVGGLPRVAEGESEGGGQADRVGNGVAAAAVDYGFSLDAVLLFIEGEQEKLVQQS